MVKVDDEYTKVLYKRSYTRYQHSKTCTMYSNQSNALKAHNAVKMKPVQQKSFYTEKGKIKRDLSIETDLCRIKRRFKKKLMQMSNADTKSLYTAMPLSAKSKYSMYTQEYPKEISSNASGCGDIFNEEPFWVNKEDLMYDNLNLLLKNWLHQSFQQDLKSLIQTALKSAMVTSDSKKEDKSSSCTTYVLERDDNRKSSSSSEQFAQKQCFNSSNENYSYVLPSCHTVPIAYKTLRLISTLSIPKTMHKRRRKNKQNKMKTKTFKLKKRQQKKMVVTLTQPKRDNKEESDININLIEVSTKSWVRRCVNMDERDVRGVLSPKGPYIVCQTNSPSTINIPRKDVGKITQITAMKKYDRVHETKNLIRSVYGKSVNTTTTTTSKRNNYGSEFSHIIKQPSGKANNFLDKNLNTVFSYQKTNFRNPTIRQEVDQIDPTVTLDYIKQNLYNPIVIYKEKQSSKCFKASNKNIAILCKRSRSSHKCFKKKHAENQHNDFTHLYKRIKKRTGTKTNIVNNLENVFNYFMHESSKNVELDLHMTISPNSKTFTATKPNKREDFVMTTPDTYDLKEFDAVKYRRESKNLVYSLKPDHLNKIGAETRRSPNIIPILDTATSKTEHIIKTDVNDKDSKDQGSMTNDLGLKDEINEIKLALKNMTCLVNSYFKREHNKKYAAISQTSSSFLIELKKENSSKNQRKSTPIVQVVTTSKRKYSGIKLSKEGKNSPFRKNSNKPKTLEQNKPFEDNILTTGASFNIIESESLIKITNMAAISAQRFKDVCLTCSLPQARSLYEASTEEEKIMENYSNTAVKHDSDLQTEQTKTPTFQETAVTPKSSNETKYEGVKNSFGCQKSFEASKCCQCFVTNQNSFFCQKSVDTNSNTTSTSIKGNNFRCEKPIETMSDVTKINDFYRRESDKILKNKNFGSNFGDDTRQNKQESQNTTENSNNTEISVYSLQKEKNDNTDLILRKDGSNNAMSSTSVPAKSDETKKPSCYESTFINTVNLENGSSTKMKSSSKSISKSFSKNIKLLCLPIIVLLATLLFIYIVIINHKIPKKDVMLEKAREKQTAYI